MPDKGEPPTQPDSGRVHPSGGARQLPGRLAFAIALAAGVFAVVLAWSGAADRVGGAAVEDAMQRALVAFGLARALNGVISVAQETEWALQPAGIGPSLAIGQILDPVNDLVERFSWVMLASTTVLGVERLLLEILSWPGVTLALAFLVGALAVALWQRAGWLASRRGWLVRLTLFVLLLRFLVPMLALLSEAIHDAFIAPRFDAAISSLEEAAGQLDQMAQVAPTGAAEASGWSDRLQRWFAETGEALDVPKRLEQIRLLAAETIDRSIELIAIFAFQTVVLPIAFLWLLRGGYRMLWRGWRSLPVPGGE